MGVVRNQAIKNSIYSYIGVGLGYLNLVLLFPNFFSTEQYGLIQLMISVVEVYGIASMLGLMNSVTKFFPFFKTDDKVHNGFLVYIFTIAFVGYSILTILYLVFRPLIIDAYIKNSSLFIDYFYFLIPFALFTMMLNILETVARAVYKTSLATFTREVGLRVLTTIGIVIYIFKIFDFRAFVIYYVCIYLVCALIILIQIIVSGEFSIRLSFKQIRKDKVLEMLKYGGFTLISGAAMITGVRIPGLMIGSMVGLSMVGVYYFYFYIASILYVPMRALSRISVPIIATAWKENKLEEIRDIYRRTSVIQLIIGSLLYVGIIINKHNLFFFIKNPEYSVNFIFFMIIGLGVMIDISVGLNSEILVNSPDYRYDSFFNVMLLIVSVVSTYILIPISGGIGAAFGFVASYFTFNFLKWLFLYRKYKLQPFDYKQLIVVVSAVLIYFVGNAIPVINFVFLDIAVRSSIVTLIFGTLMLVLKVSPDLSERFTVYKSVIINRFK
ncbi:MAG: hypothetical protein PHN88_10985 [Ignavibacteria bacterium]|nr:hypothetical protein [Ignavibacteria bacterium]